MVSLGDFPCKTSSRQMGPKLRGTADIQRHFGDRFSHLRQQILLTTVIEVGNFTLLKFVRDELGLLGLSRSSRFPLEIHVVWNLLCPYDVPFLMNARPPGRGPRRAVGIINNEDHEVGKLNIVEIGRWLKRGRGVCSTEKPVSSRILRIPFRSTVIVSRELMNT
jgi:hypothetical protein